MTIAAVKLLVARPKDIDLLRRLIASSHLDPALLRSRLDLLPVSVEHRPRLLAHFQSLTR